MCELCVVPPQQSASQRHKLWEIRPDLHCSIIGTCLSYADLLKIGRKAGFVPSETATEYEVHNYFVHRAEEPDRLARLMHKALDTKYRSAIHACQQAQCGADLEDFWSDALAKGDIPGPYWAFDNASADLGSAAGPRLRRGAHALAPDWRGQSSRCEAPAGHGSRPRRCQTAPLGPGDGTPAGGGPARRPSGGAGASAAFSGNGRCGTCSCRSPAPRIREWGDAPSA